jgi:beta-N-acetylhexosaminidase
MTPLRKQVGQLLIAGLEGPELSALENSWLKIIAPGGVILFRRNIEEAGQTHNLLAEVNSLTGTPLFLCVDLEGGLVDRLRDLIAPMPSLAAVAASGRKSMFVKHGKLIGREASMLGFNVVFAPVLDLGSPESRSVLRSRAYFCAPEEVAGYAEAFLDGLDSVGIQGCGKHFPGLGGGSLDSHHVTPVIERTWDDLWQKDLLPYRHLKSRLPMVMISHASYPATGDSRPASISRHWITDVLIKRIGYRGLIISDDMEMGGILGRASIEEAAVQAVLAGCHLIEICKNPALILRAYEALLAEAEQSPAFRNIVENTHKNILRAKQTIRAFPTKAPSQLQFERLRTEIVTFQVKHPEPQIQVEQ